MGISDLLQLGAELEVHFYCENEEEGRDILSRFEHLGEIKHRKYSSAEYLQIETEKVTYTAFCDGRLTGV